MVSSFQSVLIREVEFVCYVHVYASAYSSGYMVNGKALIGWVGVITHSCMIFPYFDNGFLTIIYPYFDNQCVNILNVLFIFNIRWVHSHLSTMLCIHHFHIHTLLHPCTATRPSPSLCIASRVLSTYFGTWCHLTLPAWVSGTGIWRRSQRGWLHPLTNEPRQPSTEEGWSREEGESREGWPERKERRKERSTCGHSPSGRVSCILIMCLQVKILVYVYFEYLHLPWLCMLLDFDLVMFQNLWTCLNSMRSNRTAPLLHLLHRLLSLLSAAARWSLLWLTKERVALWYVQSWCR